MFDREKPQNTSSPSPHFPTSTLTPIPQESSSPNLPNLTWSISNTPISPPESTKEMTNPWRRWHKEKGEAETLHHIPNSTAKIPDTLYHVTHYSSLDSIKKTGLDPSFVNTKKGLNAEAEVKDYALRDNALKAIYLGTSEDPGMSMSGNESLQKGGKVVLAVQAPQEFKLANLRSSYATGSADRIDEDELGNTVLSFGKIPPELISVQHPETKKLHNISELEDTTDWRPYATQPSSGEQLPSREELEEEQRKKEEMLEKLKKQSSEFTPVSITSQPYHEKQEPEFKVSNELASRFDTFKEKQGQSDQEEDDDDEWKTNDDDWKDT